MALFKIHKGLKGSLPTTYNEGYCYFTTDDGKFYIDTTNTAAGRIILNANVADALTTTSAGDTAKPVYWSNGKPAALSATVGGTAQPVYLSGGTITKLSANVGDASTPVYLKAGVITACSGVQTVGLTHIGTAAPTSENYVLWVDTDEADSLAMRADAIKYKTFSIEQTDWSGSGPYTWEVEAPGITANSAIINLTLDATSQTYQKAQLDWETSANTITLSTATIPTGTISGYLIATDVTVI